jgi:hypothetical protein
MKRILGPFVLSMFAVVILTNCGGGWKAVSVDQNEQISMEYNKKFGTAEVDAISSSGERFNGTLIWIPDSGYSGRYRGSLIGNKGRRLSVELECNIGTGQCVGTAKANTGQIFHIQ